MWGQLGIIPNPNHYSNEEKQWSQYYPETCRKRPKQMDG